MDNTETKAFACEDDYKASPESLLSGDSLIDFRRYLKIKTALITWNLAAASTSFFVFVVWVWRIMTGNRRPWLFQYAFPEGEISDAVYTIEATYFPKSLGYVDLLYIVTPIYATMLYMCNAFTIVVSISLKNYHYLRASKSISAVMSVPCMILIIVFCKCNHSSLLFIRYSFKNRLDTLFVANTDPYYRKFSLDTRWRLFDEVT